MADRIAKEGSLSRLPEESPVRYWWVVLQDRLDKLFASLSHAAMEQARPLAGEHVLDVGCGCGATVIDIARRVGASGKVVGVDVSAQVLDRAAERIAAEGLTHQVTLIHADAETHPFTPGSVDLIFSRLGVMFFSNPVAAFANLRGALKPLGRMVFACPRTPAENRYISTAVQAARPVLPPDAMSTSRPGESGMFSFADPERVRRILESAGFREVEFLRHDGPMQLGGPGDAADAAAFSTSFGPLARVRASAAPELQELILQRVTETYRQLEGPDGIVLDGAFWIVIARP